MPTGRNVERVFKELDLDTEKKRQELLKRLSREGTEPRDERFVVKYDGNANEALGVHKEEKE